MSYLFNKNTRYVTAGIANTLPLELQLFLWSALDEQIKKGKILDYLQIFSFQKDENELLVIHIQEQPKFKSVFHLKYIMKYEEILDKKIYIIDDIDHSTMLFSSEY